jgi:hypothetical protein
MHLSVEKDAPPLPAFRRNATCFLPFGRRKERRGENPTRVE